MSTKCVKKSWKWVQLCENAISPMWKRHQNLLPNNNDAPSITKYGFLVWPNSCTARTLHTHCAVGAPYVIEPAGVLNICTFFTIFTRGCIVDQGQKTYLCTHTQSVMSVTD